MEDKIVFLRLAFVATFFGGRTWLGKQKGAEIKKNPKWFGNKEDHIKEQQKRRKNLCCQKLTFGINRKN